MKRINKHTKIYKHLKQDEIIDYKNGVFVNDKMYQLELHLNECELCSDALEGATYMTNANKVFASTSNALEHKKNVSINHSRVLLLVGLSVVLISSLFYWRLSISSEDKKDLDMVVDNEEKVEMIDPVMVEDSTILYQDTDTSSFNDTLVVDTYTNVEVPVTPIPPTLKKKDTSIMTDSNERKKTPATVPAVDKSVVVEKEKEKEKEDKPLLEAVDNDSNKGKIKENNITESIVDKEDRAIIGEEAVLLKDRKNATPEGGMHALKEYFKKNINYPQQAIENKIKGTVVLEITISPKGKIVNIIVIRSIGFGCDNEAMRLVMDGPQWQPVIKDGIKIESKSEVRVNFKK